MGLILAALVTAGDVGGRATVVVAWAAVTAVGKLATVVVKGLVGGCRSH